MRCHDGDAQIAAAQAREIVEDANGQIVQANLGVFASRSGPLC